jgi:hypothetical protein
LIIFLNYLFLPSTKVHEKNSIWVTVKGTNGTKVKVLFQGLHVSLLRWFIIYNFVFRIPRSTLHFRYKYMLTTNWFYIMNIMHSCSLSHIYEQLLLSHTFKIHNFKVKNIFEPNVLKWVIKTIFINSSPFAFLIINVKILFNFQKEWCTFGRKKGHLKKTRIVHPQGLNALTMQIYFWFVSSFEHVKFAINGKYSKKLWQSKILCFPCDLSNIQKCSFKECPLTWVANLNVILPFKQLFQTRCLGEKWTFPRIIFPLKILCKKYN